MKNRNPFQPWNHPMLKNDPFAPWNSFDRNDPFKPWNSPFGDYCDVEDKESRKYLKDNGYKCRGWESHDDEY